MFRRWLPPALRAALFFAVYVATANLLHGSGVFRQGFLWLPTGVAVSGLCLLGTRYWPVVTLGTLAHRLLSGYLLHMALPAAAGNSLEALAAIALLRRLDFRRDFGRLRDALALLAAALIAPAISATLGRSTYLLAPGSLSFFDGWAGWWRMNSLGILVVVPVVLAWVGAPRPRLRAGAAVEIGALVAAVVALAAFIISVDPARDQSGMVLTYLALPLALYAAVRFGVRGGVTASAGLVVILALGTAHSFGPFVMPPSEGAPYPMRELALQAVIAILSATPLLLGAAIAERESATAAATHERERREELLDSINRNVNEGLFRTTEAGALVYVNTALARLLGYDPPEALLGMTVREFAADPPHADDLLRIAIQRGHFHSEEVQLVRRDGTQLAVLLSCTHVAASEGNPASYDGAVTDITARKRLEEQLRQTQKLEALGKLAGGVAHDFNNLLTAIGGYAEGLRNELPEGSPGRHDADEIARASARAARLTGQLLAYSRRQRLDPQVLDLAEVVDSLGGMLRRLIGEDVQLGTHHSGTPARVRADRGQLEQVILNLALNARDAMPAGGTVTIETGLLLPEDVPAHQEHPRSPHACLVVRDTGTGMSSDVIARAFDPFFTTKEQGKGTGLGLSTVYGIVRQSGGDVWLQSEPGVGTTAHVSLPLVPDAPVVPDAPPPSRAAEGRRGGVLVAEDEPLVRELISRTLRGAGYTVLAGGDGLQALELGLDPASTIDLVVTDVIMPRMGGRELVTRLHARLPRLRVLFVSGYASESLDPARVVEPGIEYLQKPFTPTELLERVRGCLAARSPGGA